MARNASGVYSLPVAAYISGTVIKSADMNSNLSDIATALTQSLATTGVSVMTAPLPIIAGLVGAPGLAFVGSLTTGFYSPAANQAAVTCNSVQAMLFTSTQVSTALPMLFSGSTTTFGSTVVTYQAGATFSFASTTPINNLLAALAQNFTIMFTIDGGGSVPLTGNKGFQEVPCGCTIVRQTIMADQSGSCVVDIQKSSYAGFPPSVSICAAAKPTLTAQQNNQDSTLTGWTTSLSAGDILQYNLNSATTCQRIQVSLLCKRTTQ